MFLGWNIAVYVTYLVSNLQTTGILQLSLINAIKNWLATEKMVHYIETTPKKILCQPEISSQK